MIRTTPGILPASKATCNKEYRKDLGWFAPRLEFYQRVRQSLFRRSASCTEAQGGHFEHFP